MKADVRAGKAGIDASVEKLLLKIDNNDKAMEETKLRVNKQQAEVNAELAGIDVSIEKMLLRIDNNDTEIEDMKLRVNKTEGRRQCRTS